jgi:hypothetical protein
MINYDKKQEKRRFVILQGVTKAAQKWRKKKEKIKEKNFKRFLPLFKRIAP